MVCRSQQLAGPPPKRATSRRLAILGPSSAAVQITFAPCDVRGPSNERGFADDKIVGEVANQLCDPHCLGLAHLSDGFENHRFQVALTGGTEVGEANYHLNVAVEFVPLNSSVGAQGVQATQLLLRSCKLAIFRSGQ